ncbi:MAG: hypothetical protein EOO90_17170 [Pedobacter sp.]|nr:MAG: hypothetical protein EOO90_17170 [Pedobacter sp.]
MESAEKSFSTGVSNQEEINSILKNHYEKFYNDSLNFLKSRNALKRKVSFPLLVKPYPDYFESQTKLMIFGKETYSWKISENLPYMKEDITNNDVVGTLLKKYKDFNLGIDRNSPFWNFCHKLNRKFNKSDRAFIWNNISKVDENRSTPNWFILKELSANSGIINKEIDLLKPEVVVFLTGSIPQSHLNNIFKGLQMISLNESIFRMQHISLPFHSYKTAHPKSLRLNKTFDSVIDFICNDFKIANGIENNVE